MHKDRLSGRTALYRFYDSADQLLYVGITHDIQERWDNHSRRQPWWMEVDRKETLWLDTRAEAEQLEQKAIREEGPRYDKSGRTGMRATAETNYVMLDPRLDEETDRAANVLRAVVQSGEYPEWSLLPSLGDLSKKYGLALIGVEKALSRLDHSERLVTLIHDRYVVGDHKRIPRQAMRKHGAVYFWASRHFGDRAFTSGELAAKSGYSMTTIQKHLKRLCAAGVVKAGIPGTRTRPGRFWVVKHPEPDPPPRRWWTSEDVTELADWLVQQLNADRQASPEVADRIERDLRIVEHCRPDIIQSTYSVAAPVLREIAAPYKDRPGYQSRWSPEKAATTA